MNRTTEDPFMATLPAIGDDVAVVWHDSSRGGVPTTTYGELGIETDAAGTVTALVLTGDGSATRIARGDLFSVETDADRCEARGQADDEHFHCQLPDGHAGQHNDDGVEWGRA